MLGFTCFVNNFLRKIKGCLVFGKHNEKIKVSSELILNILQNLRLRGVYLELIV